MLEKLGAEKGQIDIGDVDRNVIQEAMNTRRETPHMANAWLTTLNNMFDWAMQEQTDPATGRPFRLDSNPCEFVKRFPPPKEDDLDDEGEDGHATWSDQDLVTFEAAYPHGTRQRLIYEVLLCTGLRVGDAARVGRQHVKDGVVRLKTEKTRTPVALRVLPRLEHALAAGPKGFDTELVWITGKNRKAMQKGYLGDFLGNAAKKIGLDRSAHGLRKAAARRYIEAGPGQSSSRRSLAGRHPQWSTSTRRCSIARRYRSGRWTTSFSTPHLPPPSF